MRIILTLALAISALAATAQQRVITSIATTVIPEKEGAKPDPPTYEYYYYDKEGQTIWRQTDYARYIYNPGKTSNLIQRFAWIKDEGYTPNCNITEDLNEQGNITMLTESLIGTYARTTIYTYSDYTSDGVATAWNEYGGSLDNLWYKYRMDITRDDKGRITEKQVFELDPDDGDAAVWEPYETYTYTYKANGDIETETYQKGTKKEERSFTYATVGEAFASSITTCKDNGNNTVTLEWTAVPNATEYIVTFDQSRITVKGTSYTTPQLINGDHDFIVQPVVNGEIKNATTPMTATVRDEGMKPVSNVTIGTIKELTVISEEGDKNTAYSIPITWTLPTDASPIKSIRVYFKNNYYNYRQIDNAKATSYTLQLFDEDVRNTITVEELEDGELVPVKYFTDGADLPISVAVVYASGESEHSAPIIVNPYNQLHPEVGIEKIDHESAVPQAIYNLSGAPLAQPQHGINIINGHKVLIRK